MAERFSADLLFILFVLLVAALLGFLIGYLLGKLKKCPRCPELDKEIEGLKLKAAKSEEENTALKLKAGKLEEEITSLKLKIGELVEGAKSKLSFDAGKAREILGFRVTEDDLKIVEGIGPKISEILKNRGIKTWKSLSETSPELIKEYLLQDGGERYRIHEPGTWPEQAKLAFEGKWNELKELQASLSGGRKVS